MKFTAQYDPSLMLDVEPPVPGTEGPRADREEVVVLQDTEKEEGMIASSRPVPYKSHAYDMNAVLDWYRREVEHVADTSLFPDAVA